MGRVTITDVPYTSWSNNINKNNDNDNDTDIMIMIMIIVVVVIIIMIITIIRRSDLRKKNARDGLRRMHPGPL